MKVTLPMPPNRGNAREHFWTTHKRKKRYYELARNALFVQRAAWPNTEAPQKVGLYAVLYGWNEMDEDNAVARLKWPIDVMVKYGLIVDDSRSHLRILGLPIQEIDRANRRIEIDLVDCVLHPLDQYGEPSGAP